MDVAGVIAYVTDQGGPGEPRLRDLAELAEGGRGLLTVDALAATWSWTGTPQGRTVRATFPARPRGDVSQVRSADRPAQACRVGR